VAFGEFGLKATDRCRMTAREIEAARRAISRYVSAADGSGIRRLPDVPIDPEAARIRMGSGKGNVEYWVGESAAGKVLFEIEGMSGDHCARGVLRLASPNCRCPTAFVKRQVRT